MTCEKRSLLRGGSVGLAKWRLIPYTAMRREGAYSKNKEMGYIVVFNKKGLWALFGFENGAPERSRTHNLQIRSLTLYPIELRAHGSLIS